MWPCSVRQEAAHIVEVDVVDALERLVHDSLHRFLVKSMNETGEEGKREEEIRRGDKKHTRFNAEYICIEVHMY